MLRAMARWHHRDGSPNFHRVLPILLALCAGCGGAGSNPDDGSGPVPVDHLGPLLVDDVCAVLLQCTTSDYCSADHCRADQYPRGIATLTAEVAMGWIQYDAAAAGACHRKFAADPCHFGDFPTVPTVYQVLSFCPGVLTPTRHPGDTCDTSAACVDGSCVLSGSCPGHCAAFLVEGAPCTAGGADCDPRAGLQCESGTCAKPRTWKIGDACAALADCLPDLWCNTNAKSCAALADVGQPCDTFGKSAPFCKSGLECSSQTMAGTCRAPSGSGGPCLTDDGCTMPLVCLPGGTCGSPSSAGGPCDTYLDCGPDLTCSNKTCQPAPGLGDPCDDFNPCASAFRCDGGTCKTARCPGDACDAQSVCRFGICNLGLCVARTPIGSSCTDDLQCVSSSCQMSVCIDESVCQ